MTEPWDPSYTMYLEGRGLERVQVTLESRVIDIRVMTRRTSSEVWLSTSRGVRIGVRSAPELIGTLQAFVLLCEVAEKIAQSPAAKKKK